MHMVRVELELSWKLGTGEPLPVDPALFALLSGIDDTGSLQQAARRAGVSYRHAWGLLGHWGRALGRPLAELRRGQGTRLAPLGRALLAARQHVDDRLGPDLHRLAGEAAQGLGRGRAPAPLRLRIHASHDLALLRSRDLLATSHGLVVDLETHGSLESLAALAQRRCDIAGFHVEAASDPASAVRALVASRAQGGVRLLEMVRRRQGLMLRPGLDAAVRSLADIASGGVRFINRQRDSGTRALLDALLARNGVRAADIRGYEDEEFTHLAVAATVAGGGADVGFGIHAAAAQFGLPFVPLAVETYYLAWHADRIDRTALARLLDGVRSQPFRALCNALPGYDASQAGRVVAPAPPRGPARAARRSRHLRAG